MVRVYIQDPDVVQEKRAEGFDVKVGERGGWYYVARDESPKSEEDTFETELLAKLKTDAKKFLYDNNYGEFFYNDVMNLIEAPERDIINYYEKVRDSAMKASIKEDDLEYLKLLGGIRTAIYSRFKKSPEGMKLSKLREKLHIGDKDE